MSFKGTNSCDFIRCNRLGSLTNKNPCALAHGQSQISPLKTPWFALRATKEKTALARRNSDFFPILVSLYDKARTYFEEKC
jgi:hypothetical protein